MSVCQSEQNPLLFRGRNRQAETGPAWSACTLQCHAIQDTFSTESSTYSHCRPMNGWMPTCQGIHGLVCRRLRHPQRARRAQAGLGGIDHQRSQLLACLPIWPVSTAPSDLQAENQFKPKKPTIWTNAISAFDDLHQAELHAIALLIKHFSSWKHESSKIDVTVWQALCSCKKKGSSQGTAKRAARPCTAALQPHLPISRTLAGSAARSYTMRR